MNHRTHHPGRIEPILVERVAGLMSEGDQERQLCAAVAFAERMDGIELGEKMRGSLSENHRIESTKTLLSRELTKQPSHFAIDVLRIAERASLLGDAHGSNFSCPGVDVLKQVSVNGAVMAGSQSSRRQRLAEPL